MTEILFPFFLMLGRMAPQSLSEVILLHVWLESSFGIIFMTFGNTSQNVLK